MNQHISVANKYTSKIKKGNVSDKLFVLLYTKEKEPLSSGGIEWQRFGELTG